MYQRIICKFKGHIWSGWVYSWLHKNMWRYCSRCFKSETKEWRDWWYEQQCIEK